MTKRIKAGVLVMALYLLGTSAASNAQELFEPHVSADMRSGSLFVSVEPNPWFEEVNYSNTSVFVYALPRNEDLTGANDLMAFVSIRRRGSRVFRWRTASRWHEYRLPFEDTVFRNVRFTNENSRNPEGHVQFVGSSGNDIYKVEAVPALWNVSNPVSSQVMGKGGHDYVRFWDVKATFFGGTRRWDTDPDYAEDLIVGSMYRESDLVRPRDPSIFDEFYQGVYYTGDLDEDTGEIDSPSQSTVRSFLNRYFPASLH